ncbi:MAG: MerR family transcriptional regulator [Nostocoides sp.]
MRVKDMASLSGTTVRTIRYYHQLGLLSVPETSTGWRAYGFAHLTRLMRIRWLVEAGVPLAEVPHLIRPPGSADERSLAVEDLTAVLESIEEKVGVLTAQRERVQILLERVRTHGRLTPLPQPVVRVYAALLERPLPPGMRDAMSRERDLLELACYRGAMPSDVTALLEAMDGKAIDELIGLWEEAHRLATTTASRLSEHGIRQVRDVVGRTLDLAYRTEPTATQHLLRRAAELDRPAVRAAIDLAYASPVYREFVRAVMTVAKEGQRA